MKTTIKLRMENKMSVENGNKGMDTPEMARYLEKNEICRNIQALSLAISGIYIYSTDKEDTTDSSLYADLKRALKIEARVFLDLENMSHED